MFRSCLEIFMPKAKVVSGPPGPPGPRDMRGESAYDIDKRVNGFRGTEAEWLERCVYGKTSPLDTNNNQTVVDKTVPPLSDDDNIEDFLDNISHGDLMSAGYELHRRLSKRLNVLLIAHGEGPLDALSTMDVDEVLRHCRKCIEQIKEYEAKEEKGAILELTKEFVRLARVHNDEDLIQNLLKL